MLNDVTIMGRLVRNPELRYTQNQTPVASFTLACERDRKNENGERETDYIDCSAWKQTAKFIDAHFAKGTLAIVRGRLQIRKWTGKDGNNRTAPEIIVADIYFGESKRRIDTEERPPMPTDADAPPEVDMEQKQRDLAELAIYGNVNFVDVDDGDGSLPF